MRLLIACLAAAASLAVPAAAGAATIIVDSTEDGAATGKCTLRAAIEASNSNSVKDGCIAGSGSDRIEFALAGPATITLGAELPKVSAPVEIDGPGAAALTVSGNHAVRVLKVGGAAVTVSDLTIADGRSTFGAGIYNESSASLLLTGVAVTANQAIVEGGTNAFPSGGGIFNQGQLTLVESSVAQNSAQALLASSQNASEGGGIANLNGTLVLERSTLRGNSSIAVASAGSGTTNAVGGGISNNSALAVLDSTLSGNEASGSGSTIGNRGSGGGISNGNNPGVVNASIIRSTIVGNEAAASTPVSSVGGGGLVLYGTGSQVIGSTIADNRAAAGGANVQFFDAALVRSTIIARPAVGVSCSGTGTSLGFNIDEGTTCGFNQPSDQSGVDALLAPALAANGGPTETLALLFGSPAIDKGLSLGAETIDQRGRLRPVEIPSVPNAPGGNGADVGAYEVQTPHATIVGGPSDGETIRDPEPTFEFVADEAGASFLCAVDNSAPAPCASPFKLPRLSDGPHLFQVAAYSIVGYGVEPPRSRGFTVDTRVPEPRRDTPTTTPPPSPATVAPAPKATISGLPARTTKTRLKIRFSSDQAGSTFTCKLDRRKWRSCRSPYRTPELALGRHTFRLKVTGPTGVAGGPAAVKAFRVIAPPPAD